MSYTQAALRDLIDEAAISGIEKGRLYAFVDTRFPAAEQATIGVPPTQAVAELQGYLSLPAGKLVARFFLMFGRTQWFRLYQYLAIATQSTVEGPSASAQLP